MSAGSDSTYLSKTDDKMTGRREFCWGQLFGVFLFCGGFAGGILIGIYVYHEGASDEVNCKNIPEWLIKGNVTIPSPQTTSTVAPTTTAKRRTFTYSINNQIKDPLFNHSMTMQIRDKRPLIYYMQRAVDTQKTEFTGFKCTYFSSLGFFIDSINKLAGNYADDKTYWQILNSTGPLPVGVSSYIPTDGDEVLLNFTVGGHTD